VEAGVTVGSVGSVWGCEKDSGSTATQSDRFSFAIVLCCGIVLVVWVLLNTLAIQYGTLSREIVLDLSCIYYTTSSA